MWEPEISPRKHAKKYVFGVFLHPTRIALVRKNQVGDIALNSGAPRGLRSDYIIPYMQYLMGSLIRQSDPKSGP